jgi:hypothetical protein
MWIATYSIKMSQEKKRVMVMLLRKIGLNRPIVIKPMFDSESSLPLFKLVTLAGSRKACACLRAT